MASENWVAPMCLKLAALIIPLISDKYHGSWCSGSFCQQDTSSHRTGIMETLLQSNGFSNTFLSSPMSLKSQVVNTICFNGIGSHSQHYNTEIMVASGEGIIKGHLLKHTEAWREWLPFCRYFQMHFLEWRLFFFFGLHFTEVCSRGHQTSDKWLLSWQLSCCDIWGKCHWIRS